MKVSKELYATFKQEFIEKKISVDTIKQHTKKVIESGKYKSLETRILFDIFYAIRKNEFNIPNDVNDDHLATMTKAIIKDVLGTDLNTIVSSCK